MTQKAMKPEALILNLIEEVDGLSEGEIAERSGLEIDVVKGALKSLKKTGVVEGRDIGGRRVWYALEKVGPRKILIVEDDPNINNLMKIAVGSGFEIAQAYDGREAMRMVREFMPDLVLLDLMLPSLNGLEICQTIKADPSLKHMKVIIVSAADATKNRFQGIKYGADYYIKKPFEPKILRSLTNIFLKKKGRRFDPLIDLPDEKRLSKEIDALIDSGDFEIGNLRIENLNDFKNEYGEKEGEVVIRLVSQILQDKVREWDSERGLIGYIGDGEFIVGGGKNETNMVVAEVVSEFDRVLPFIYQDKRGPELDVEDIFGEEKAKDPKRLKIRYDIFPPEKLEKRREELKGRRPKPSIGEYTLEELKELLGSKNLDLVITRGPKGVQISISKGKGG